MSNRDWIISLPINFPLWATKRVWTSQSVWKVLWKRLFWTEHILFRFQYVFVVVNSSLLSRHWPCIYFPQWLWLVGCVFFSMLPHFYLGSSMTESENQMSVALFYYSFIPLLVTNYNKRNCLIQAGHGRDNFILVFREPWVTNRPQQLGRNNFPLSCGKDSSFGHWATC